MTQGDTTSRNFSSNGAYANFIGISIDAGATTTTGINSVTDTGSGISVNVAGTVFSSLSVGTHTFTLHFGTGHVSMTFTVE